MRTGSGWSFPLPPKQQCSHNKEGRQVKANVTKRAMATSTRVASDDKGDGNGANSDNLSVLMNR